jgi:glycosyltransferase involved in cell wall biosynthesis
MEEPAWSIIVATFNEEESIRATLEDLRAYLPERAEVLVVDGGSDGTAGIVCEMARTMPGLRHIAHVGDRGKGHAIRTGMREARGRVQLQFDGDGQFLARDLAALAAPIVAGTADVVLGSRFIESRGGGGLGARSFGNRVASSWASLLFGTRMTDVLAGVKAWSSDVVAVVEPRSDTFEYEVEIPARALKAGLRVVEVPVSTRDRTGGESKVSVFRVGMKILAATLKFRWS